MSAARPRAGVTSTGPAGVRPIGFALLLALTMGTGTFPGFAFGVLGPDLIAEFGLSRAGLGVLTTAHFAVGGLGSTLAGRATDHLGARRTMLIAFALVAGAQVAMAASGAFGWLLVAAAAAGVSLAAGNPATNKAVSQHLPPGRRGLTMGVKQAGVQLGAVLAGTVAAPLAAGFGWRTALLVSTVVPVAGLVLTPLLVPPDPAPPARSDGHRAAPLPRAIRRLAVYAFLLGAAAGAFNAYLPLYAVERLGTTTTRAGAIAAAVGATGVVSRILWGWLAERLSSYRLPLTGMAFGAVVAVASVLAGPRLGVAAVWFGAILFGATAVTWNAVGMVAVIGEVESDDAGRASGLVLFGFYTGFVPSPVVFGALVDATGSYGASWLLVMLLLAAAGVWARR